MKRHLFTNTALTKDGKPIYEIVYNNKMLDPSEVARSNRYDFWIPVDPYSNSTAQDNEVEDAIEADWQYGNTKFILTFGILHTINRDGNKKRVQFAGYWL